MITLVFLQVLEPFCTLSEQENSEPEEEEVSQPVSSAAVSIASQTQLNSCPSDSLSLTQKDMSCDTFLTETENVSVPVTIVSSPSFSDAESVLPPPPDYTSSLQPCSLSVPSVSNSPSYRQSGALSVEDDSCIPPQTQSDPPGSHPFIDVIAVPLSNSLSDESNCTAELT